MPNCSHLLVAPTAFELSAVLEKIPKVKLERAHCCLCGFGSIAAAARTASLIHQYRPAVVVLAGIAGSLDTQSDIGMSYEFSTVRSYGIGVGAGEKFQAAEEMGWRQWPDNDEPDDGSFGDVIQWESSRLGQLQHQNEGELLSVCSASSSREEAELRKKQFPAATAEDMEGFAVAAACTMLKVPCVVIRGISNMAGDRDQQNWHIQEALRNVSNHVGHFLVNSK